MDVALRMCYLAMILKPIVRLRRVMCNQQVLMKLYGFVSVSDFRCLARGDACYSIDVLFLAIFQFQDRVSTSFSTSNTYTNTVKFERNTLCSRLSRPNPPGKC